MKIRTWLAMSFGAAVGAGLTYLLDPDRGRERRVEARDMLMRKAQELDLDKKARYYAGQARGGFFEAARGIVPSRGDAPTDAMLRDKVESEVLGRVGVGSGTVNVDAADGVVTLRGQIPNQHQIDRLVELTQAVDGVREVRSLLHLPSEPVPDRTS